MKKLFLLTATFFGLATVGFCEPTAGSYTTTFDERELVSITGTVLAVLDQPESDNVQLQIQDSIGGGSSVYNASKHVETRDAANRPATIADVKRGSAVTIYIQGDRITKIYINNS